MNSVSIFKALDLPSAFGAALLILTLILAAAPYLPSGDFGPIKIPDFDSKIRKKLIWVGPIAFVLSLGLFIPFFSRENAVRLTNPFGAQQILLDGNTLLITANEMSSAATKKTDAILSYPKELFYINKPTEESGFKFELIKPKAYLDQLSEKLNPNGGGLLSIFAPLLEAELASTLDDPIYATGEVFRIFKSPPFTLELNANSRIGPVVSTQQFEEAKKEDRETLGRQLKTFTEKFEGERKSKEMDGTKMAEQLQDLQKQLTEVMGDTKAQKNVFNELSMLIIDRKLYERRRMINEGGREIVASPLQFMLSAGGRLPDFDLLSVKEASVSSDNRVWGFYGQTQWLNVKLNGAPEKVVHYDFYRIYVMNSSYLYQITLSYIPTPEQPSAIERNWRRSNNTPYSTEQEIIFREQGIPA